jgi:serine/threonine protein kinase
MTETLTIPGYRIQSRLGQGGMATVYLAIQESFEREVALKVMSPLLNSDPSFAARFKREARIVAQLNHASIVPVFEVGEHQSYHYLSMEYLPAGDLKRRILDGECDLNLALKVCTALSAALEVAHRKGFVHRDIKPENILFREDGTPVLTDFGIARALDSARSMTLAGMLVGTPDYMSPEQVKGLELDGRSDLYSLGIVFYETLTGSVPFRADSTLSIALKQVGEPLPPLPPQYAEYQEFLDCLTAKDREQRFASGAEVVRALRLIDGGRRNRDRPLIRTLTPIQGLSGSSTTGTQLQRSPTAPPDETYISQPTLYRAREADGANRGLELAVTNPPEMAKHGGDVEVGGAMGAQGSSASDAQNAARPLQYAGAADSGGAIGAQSAADGADQNPTGPQQTLVSKRRSSSGLLRTAVDAESLNPRSGSDNPQAGTEYPAAAPVPMTASAPPDVQPVAGASISSGGVPPEPRTHDVRGRTPWLATARVAAVALWARTNNVGNRPLWLAVAGVTVVAICIGLVFIARSHKAAPAPTATRSQLNTPPAAPARNPQAMTVQATPAAQPTGISEPQNTPGEQKATAQVSAANPVVESDKSQSAASPAAAEARAEAAARRKRLAEERRQRKAEEARLAAEARAAELAAQETQIQNLLAAGKTQYAAGALWQPTGSSAADSYRAILKMQPQRAEALAGAQRLANVLADEAEDAEASGNLDSSRQLIDQVQSLQPTHPKLPALQARFQQLQSSPVALDARDRGRLEKAAKYVARAVEDLGRKPLDFKAMDDATDQYDKALSTAPKAPGLPSLKERLIAAYPIAVQTELDLHDTKRAQKLIGTAHKHNWLSPELDQLEATLQGGSVPTAAIKEVGAH